jgi:FdhE protein
MVTPHDTVLQQLRRQRPEWAPWLALVEDIVVERGTDAWDAAVPDGAPAPVSATPRLCGLSVSLDAGAACRLLERLIRTASSSGAPKLATLGAALTADADAVTLFAASLCQDSVRLGEITATRGGHAEAIQAVAALLPVPFLHACSRRWATSMSESWVEGYCPVCGSWPAFAEVRGIDRTRYFRCGRCSGEWHSEGLCCPYCAMRDHNELVSLVPDKAGVNAVIEACNRCRGYVKTFSRLQACPHGTVMLEDLASVDLDVAAIARGYARPTGAGRALDVSVSEKPAARRFFAWT